MEVLFYSYLYTYFVEQSTWAANRISVKKFPYFMEPKGSLPRLQMLATYPFPEPDNSKPSPPISFPEDPS